MIGFFHPFCDAMGGGEKVLFQALKALQDEKHFDNDTILIYSGASMRAEALCDAIKEKFGTRIRLKKNNLQFIKLRSHESMHGHNYPRWTLLW